MSFKNSKTLYFKFFTNDLTWNGVKYEENKTYYANGPHENIEIVPENSVIKNLVKQYDKSQYTYYFSIITTHPHAQNINHDDCILTNICTVNKIYSIDNFVFIVKYIHDKHDILKSNSSIDISKFCSYALNIGFFDIEYFHKYVGLSNPTHYQLHYNSIYNIILGKNNIDAIKYLHKYIGYSKKDFKMINNVSSSIICTRNVKILEYFHKNIGFTKQDFEVITNTTYLYLFRVDDVDIFKYLHKEIGFSKEDFQRIYNIICFTPCKRIFKYC